MNYPAKIFNWIENEEVAPAGGDFLNKYNPANGEVLGVLARSKAQDAEKAIVSAESAFEKWSSMSVVARAEILRNATQIMQSRKQEIAEIVSLETGKSVKDALGEVGGAIEMGFFVAGEGRRFYGKTTTSGVPNRTAMTVRQPIGVCALIIAANTPIANVAWKAFPALLCGNTAIMKASEDTPYTALWFAKVLKEAGLPAGVFSLIQGLGEEAGTKLVEDEDGRVRLISFTGSVPVGKYIQKVAGERLAKICLELGGKNPLVVCDDADIELAVESATLSAFSNAGQRCAAGSRIIIFDSVYNKFKDLFLKKVNGLKVGSTDGDDLGPVINKEQLESMNKSVKEAVARGATVLCGGEKLNGEKYSNGYYYAPTVLENVSGEDEISKTELFGPITILYRVKDFNEALALANNNLFGLSSAIHTKNIHRSQVFQEKIRAGVVSVNGPTYGSEPHMPFGGLKNSGNGFREAGAEALDVYSDWKTIYVKYDPKQI